MGHRRFHVGVLGRAEWSSGSFGVAWRHSGVPTDRWVHLGSREFTPARLEVVGFIRVRFGSLGRSMGLSGSFGSAWVHLGDFMGRHVHSG